MENSKTILSWDVGIKNLAFCKIKFTGDEFNILKWDIINLGEQEHICTFIGKNEVQCEKKAYEFKISGDTELDTKKHHFYCGIHIKKVCKNGKHKEIKTNCNKISLNDLAVKLYSELDKNPDIYGDVDQILIENQPTLKNPKMYGLSILLMSYFIIKGKMSTSMIAPFKKLSLNPEKTASELKKGKSKNEIYTLTKKLGKIYCMALISEDDKKIINKSKKQDDLSDSFLQGFRFMFKKIPQKYVDLLNVID
jgi:hypothetical protein